MKKNIIKNIFKSSFIAILLTFVFNVWTIVIEAWDNANNNSTKNENNFKKLESSNIAKTWVAITLNLWLRDKGKKNLKDYSLIKIYTAKEVLENRKEIEEDLIVKDMIATKEYFSILKTDFKNTIKTSSNRKETLDNILNQLRIRYNIWVKRIKSINEQRDIFVKQIEQINDNIESVKENINNNFKKTNTEEIKVDIEKYLKLKGYYYELRTLVIFENKFLEYYKVLNDYNKKLIDSLSLNRDIIIKGSYLVIPDSWDSTLKDYWILYTEEIFKEKLEKKKAD